MHLERSQYIFNKLFQDDASKINFVTNYTSNPPTMHSTIKTTSELVGISYAGVVSSSLRMSGLGNGSGEGGRMYADSFIKLPLKNIGKRQS